MKTVPSQASITPQLFTSAPEALKAIQHIFFTGTEYLRSNFTRFAQSEEWNEGRISAYYPYIRLSIKDAKRVDTRLAYGFVSKSGVHQTTLTRPDIFDHYYLEQIDLLLKNHNVPIEVGVSTSPIPIHFVLAEDFHVEKDLTQKHMELLPNIFDLPDLALMDDDIANGTFKVDQEPYPLALFTAPRVDFSLLRLQHYTATKAKHFQNYVIFTNYQFYIDEFIRMAHMIMSKVDGKDITDDRMQYTAFVEPGNEITTNK